MPRLSWWERCEIYLPLAGMLDLAGEKTRLEKELKETRSAH